MKLGVHFVAAQLAEGLGTSPRATRRASGEQGSAAAAGMARGKAFAFARTLPFVAEAPSAFVFRPNTNAITRLALGTPLAIDVEGLEAQLPRELKGLVECPRAHGAIRTLVLPARQYLRPKPPVLSAPSANFCRRLSSRASDRASRRTSAGIVRGAVRLGGDAPRRSRHRWIGRP
jgi:hypothetical protein